MAKKGTKRAAVVGAAVAPPSGVLVTWGAMELSRKTGIPAEACAALIGTVAAPLFGWITHWSAKLAPPKG